MTLRPEAERWLEREQEALARQRRESQARADAWVRCEAGDGHVFADSNECVVCLNRVPDAGARDYPY
jgi:hypothetical protein